MVHPSARGYQERNTSADKALDVLQLFDESRPTLTGAEVVAQLGIGRSAAYRYLQSLANTGFVEEAPDGPGYRLGMRVLALARLAQLRLTLTDLARPAMRALCTETGETVLLGRRSGSVVVCLAEEQPAHPVRVAFQPGDVLPLTAGAPALVLLAWSPPEQIEEVITGGLEHYTQATMTDPAALRDRLATIRDDGFAISRGEFEPGIVGIGAPIRDGSGHVIATVSTIGLASRIPDERIPRLVDHVRATAATITTELELLD
jgi:DNA-binding IclR family transcriptional regulator